MKLFERKTQNGDEQKSIPDNDINIGHCRDVYETYDSETCSVLKENTVTEGKHEETENGNGTIQDNFQIKDIENLLNSFSDMLQMEINSKFDAIDKKVEQQNIQNSNVCENIGIISQTMKKGNDILIQNLSKVIEQQETTIQKQHLAITKFQEDVLYKIQKALIMELIDIADNISMILQMQEEEKNYESLIESVRDLQKWVDASLSNNSVRKYTLTKENPEVFDRKKQEIIDTEKTCDIDKNNTYKTERPGYLWSLPYLVVNSDVQLQKILEENKSPKTFSFVIRPEEVIKLKYVAEENRNSADKEFNSDNNVII